MSYSRYPYYPPVNIDSGTDKGGVPGWFNFSDHTYFKGFLIGTAVTLVVVNPSVQKAIVKGAVKLWTTFQGGVEEIKEQVQDAKAEMSQV